MVGIFKNNLLCYVFHLHISCTRSIHYIRFREFWFIFMAFCCKMNSTKECYYLMNYLRIVCVRQDSKLSQERCSFCTSAFVPHKISYYIGSLGVTP